MLVIFVFFGFVDMSVERLHIVASESPFVEVTSDELGYLQHLI